jgi:hypothetical protein
MEGGGFIIGIFISWHPSSELNTQTRKPPSFPFPFPPLPIALRMEDEKGKKKLSYILLFT